MEVCGVNPPFRGRGEKIERKGKGSNLPKNREEREMRREGGNIHSKGCRESRGAEMGGGSLFLSERTIKINSFKLKEVRRLVIEKQTNNWGKCRKGWSIH